MKLAMTAAMLVLVVAVGCAPRQKSAGGAGAGQELSTPQGLLRTYAQAIQRGDSAALRSCMAVADPSQEAYADLLCQQTAATVAAWRAAETKFGKQGALIVFGYRSKLDPDDYARRMEQAIPTLQIMGNGDRATVVLPDLPEAPWRLVKVNGAWKIDVGATSPHDPQMQQEATAAVKRMLQSMQELAAGIRGGKYSTPQEARYAMEAAWQPAPATAGAGAAGAGGAGGAGATTRP